MILFGASPYGVDPFGGPGLIARSSARMAVTSIVTKAPVPAPPRMPVASIVTQRGASPLMPVTGITQGGHRVLLDLFNADTKQGGNPVYDSELTL